MARSTTWHLACACALALAACSGQAANETAPDDVDSAPRNVPPAPDDAATAVNEAAAAPAPAGPFEPWQSTALLSAGGIDAPTAVRTARLSTDFGAPRAAVETAVTRGSGLAPARRATNADCGAGPIAMTHYPGGLALHFQDDRFVGWSLQGDSGPRWAVATDGIGIGSARAALRDARFTASTLGDEFATGGVSGVVDKGGVVALWAGVSCNFR